jgi:hypothetical protein
MNPRSAGLALGVAGILSLAQLGCGSGGAVNQADAPIRVENTQMFVTVENRSGLNLRDVSVRIVPAGASTEFVTSVYRMENGEKRDFTLGSFRGRDGTPFNLRVVRPRSVKVSATDLNGKTVEVEVPWMK